MLFLMDDVTLSESDQQTVAAACGEWTITIVQSGRQLIHALVDSDVVAELAAFLTPYNPVILGGWDANGLPSGITASTDANNVTTYTGTALFPFDTVNATTFLTSLSGIHSFTFDPITMQPVDTGVALYQTTTDLVGIHQFGGWAFPNLNY